MYRLTRITKDPGTVLKIQVDQKAEGDPDGGFQQGGLFHFAPAGQDGDSHQMTEHAATVIMGDPGMAHHFKCDPPLPSADTGAAGAVKGVGKSGPGKKTTGAAGGSATVTSSLEDGKGQ